MGIINVSHDSFYQANPNFSDALALAEKMIADGADILDIGAVATNPNLDNIKQYSTESECEKIIPLIKSIRKNSDILISIDTSSAIVMQKSIEAGASMINDQRGLSEPGALAIIKKFQVPVCLMHYFEPKRKPESTSKEDLLTTIKSDLQNNINRCLDFGILKENIIIDPGFGAGHFGKSTDENFYLLSKIKIFVNLNFPVLIGVSRKSMFGELLNAPVENRLSGSLAAAVFAALQGVAILRVHDVKETVDAIKVIRKILSTHNSPKNLL